MKTKRTKTKKSINFRLKDNPIAIIGVAGIFPQSANIEEYWQNIFHKVDCISDVPEDRWKLEDFYDPDPQTADKTYSKRGGFIPDIDFNPMEYGLPPNILELTDNTQLLSLVVAKQLIADAGFNDSRPFNNKRTGVILGVVGGQKLMTPLNARLQYPVIKKVLESSGVSSEDTEKIIEKMKKAYIDWKEDSFPGMLGNVIAGRVANRFDLGGTNCVIDAACAGSLAAIKMAISDLLEHRSDMMISGGVDLDNSPGMYMCFSKTPAFTESDICQPFDQDSKGIMIGEGIGMMLLKRLEDAERDKNRIYAVIKGIGSSSDGRSGSIYAPDSDGQSSALASAYEDAGIDPSDVGLIEAHGTGTSAGDLAEFNGLKQVFKLNEKKQHIALGTIKSQIAHTKATAGSAGLLKIALALHHKVLPPTLNVNKPNPNLKIEKSPFYLNTETRPWINPENAAPRIAGVSAFGFGGTNFHFVLEEYKNDHQDQYKIHKGSYPIVISAENAAQLLNICQEELKYLQSENAQQHLEQLIEKYQESNIPNSNARVGFLITTGLRSVGLRSVVEDTTNALQIAIRSLEKKGDEEAWSLRGVHFRKKGLDPQAKVVALFSGQGSQYLNMGSDLAMHYPEIRKALSHMDQLFLEDSQPPLSSIVFPPPAYEDSEKNSQSDQLQLTQHAQPAIGALSVGLFKLLQKAGFEPDFTAGHSFGELTALWASGVLKDEDYYRLAYKRGQAMKAPSDPTFDAGGMLAVMGNLENIEEQISSFSEVIVANWNSTKQIVLAGPKDDIPKVKEVLEAKGLKCVSLPVSAAFHSSLVGHAQKIFKDAIKEVSFKQPKIPVFSNTTAKAHGKPTAIKKALTDHILSPVLFRQEIENIANQGGTIFVEFGPKSVLTKLVDDILKDVPHFAIALNNNPKKNSEHLYNDGLLQLCVAGLPLNFKNPYGRESLTPQAKSNSPVSIKLNGANYVSPKTAKAFEDALNDSHTIAASSVPQAIDKDQNKLTEKVVNSYTPSPPTVETKIMYKPTNNNPSQPLPDSPASTGQQVIKENLNNTLTQFCEHQTQTLKVHEQYLKNQQDYSNAFLDLMKQQYASFGNGGVPSFQIPASVEQGMQQFQNHHAETLNIHSNYLEHQAAFSQNVYQLIQNQYALLGQGHSDVSIPLVPPVMHNNVQIQPKQQIAPVTPPQPVIAQVAPQPSTVPTTPQPMVATPLAVPSKPVVQAPVEIQKYESTERRPTERRPVAPNPVSSATSVNVGKLQKVLLSVVSDKTGYPEDMLDLNMDMEADLGIDSIKRVEILAAMENQIPELPELKQEDLVELRTLDEIVEHVKGIANSSEPHSVPATTTQPIASSKPQSIEIDLGAVSQVMLSIISEKTGYPTDMLELNMDMEADLGIDSIKRVEILAAMESHFPELPELTQERLVELRTLEEIVEHVKSVAESNGNSSGSIGRVDPTSAIEQTPIATEIDMEELRRGLLSIVSEKTGYPTDMLELNMDMEADLGIDSIKRVEILAAMESLFPNMPELKQEDMVELRTLEEIIGYVNGRSEKSQPLQMESRDVGPLPTGKKKILPEQSLATA